MNKKRNEKRRNSSLTAYFARFRTKYKTIESTPMTTGVKHFVSLSSKVFSNFLNGHTRSQAENVHVRVSSHLSTVFHREHILMNFVLC